MYVMIKIETSIVKQILLNINSRKKVSLIIIILPDYRKIIDIFPKVLSEFFMDYIGVFSE